ncbi:Proliferation-associated protein 2G4 [Fasciola hepatica]|uniref:Proliferation-associated protein 2G4 n=1 Tax=Fasciola hepatica TaxID=6192 RepID=A0A4E0R1Y3_FASHE|nr:Proliferation-associated protein 2G4 [Fasciola hepatica]
MSDHESDEEATVLDDIVVNKYKMAAEIANSLSFPTSISINNIICHYAPLEGEDNAITELKDEDLVKIDLGAHIDGFAAVVGHTVVVGSSQERRVTGKKADVVIAAHTAAEVALRQLRPGNESIKLSELVTKTASDFHCRPVEGMQSHQMRRMVYDAEKAIVLNPSEEHKKSIEKCTFEVNEVWNIDILVSSGDGKAREHKARTTIYKKNETLYQLKMKASRRKALEDLKKARLGITECAKHDVVQALPVYCEKEDEFVAQFRFTVLLMPNGPMRITGLPFDAGLYKSECKVKDAEVKEVLLQPIKNQNKKKKPNKLPAEAAGDKN